MASRKRVRDVERSPDEDALSVSFTPWLGRVRQSKATVLNTVIIELSLLMAMRRKGHTQLRLLN